MSEQLQIQTKRVVASWDALEDAFENNASEVHSYLHFETGEVVRVVEGQADAALYSRLLGDPNYMLVDPVSSREQYRWMERFIATVEDAELRHKLFRSIDGKGAFRRFKDVLMSYPLDRERWFAFRSERVRACMEAWLTTHGIEVIERQDWKVPSKEDIAQRGRSEDPEAVEVEDRLDATLESLEDVHRQKLQRTVEALPSYELDTALAFLEFLVERSFSRRQSPRVSGVHVASSPSTVEATKNGSVAMSDGGGHRDADLPAPSTENDVETLKKPEKRSGEHRVARVSGVGKSGDRGGDGVLFASQLPPEEHTG